MNGLCHQQEPLCERTTKDSVVKGNGVSIPPATSRCVSRPCSHYPAFNLLYFFLFFLGLHGLKKTNTRFTLAASKSLMHCLFNQYNICMYIHVSVITMQQVPSLHLYSVPVDVGIKERVKRHNNNGNPGVVTQHSSKGMTQRELEANKYLPVQSHRGSGRPVKSFL